jgi:assimilatory nitrate reductase catalytic subunit
MLLVPSATPPVAVQSRGKQICTCFNVTGSAIATQLGQCTGTEDQRLVQLQAALQCGTNCGSCLPEVKNLVRLSIPAGQRDATLGA